MNKQCRDITNISQVFSAEFPTLASLRKEVGDDGLEAYVGVWITNTVEFFQVGKRMGEEQINETAMMIMQDYYMLTLADINLVFQRAKKGHYGELYDRLDGAVILTWFRKYFDERCETAESLSMRHHDSQKQKNNTQRTTGQAVQQIREAVHQYKLEKLQQGK